jgi:hypothetical protein
MALLVPDEGEVRLLTYALKSTCPATYKLKLYKTDVTPAEADTIASYTVCDATGYGDATITNADDWTVATDTGTTTATCAEKTFTFTAASNIYGYYVVDETGDDKVLWAEKFSDAPHVIPAGGGTQKITLKLTGA